MDNILGKTKFAQRGPASATLVGFATTAKAGVRSEDHASNSMPVAAMAASCLLPTGIITTSPQIPTLVTSPVLCKVTPKLNPSPSCSTERPLPSLSPKPVSLVNHQPLKRRLRHLRLNSMGSRVAQQQGQAEERTVLLRSFLTAQEERIRLDEQHQRKADARERRKENQHGPWLMRWGGWRRLWSWSHPSRTPLSLYFRDWLISTEIAFVTKLHWT